MLGLAWISVTANGKVVPVRIKDITSVFPLTGSVAGSRIYFVQGGAPLEVSETPAAIFTLINTKWTDWITAIT